ncbi:MAG: hypothetical protein JWQ87_5237 [Candidatus Sulfotelmatobacter sp.]|nr:hypothetical protein [Candidatus Sulfotelmatobacter sp.]
MRNHDDFKALSAAAVAGQISQANLPAGEWKELTDHWQECAECREFVGDFVFVLVPSLAEVAQNRHPMRAPVGATERFVARARTEGIPLQSRNRREQKRSTGARIAFLVAAAIAGMLALTLVARIFLQRHAAIREPAHIAIVSPSSPVPPVPPKRDLERQDSELRAEVARLQSQVNSLAAKSASQKQTLDSANSQNVDLRSQLETVHSAKDELAKKIADREAELAQLRTVKDADEIAVRVKDADVASLREHVDKLTEDLHRAEELSAAANDAKDLIVARNLHVIDVNDNNENGKRQKPFGRVYYAEGQMLRFYAYDLADHRELDSKVQFYVWGEKNGVMVKTLGVLHSDSLADGRWRLDFHDPQVLAKIDTVFVTVEKQQKSITKPSGKRILYAVLGDRPNHP